MAGICVVVLGGGHSADGLSLDARTPERVKRGVELFMAAMREAGESADVRLVCSGAWAVTRSVPPPRTEAALMADLAVTLGVPPSAILREERSLDTIGNLAVVGSEILPRIEPDEVVVVSSNFHMRRVRYLVGRVWGGRWRVTFAGAPEDLPVRTRLLLAVRERRLMLLMRRLLRKIPRGDIAGCLRARPLREAPSGNG